MSRMPLPWLWSTLFFSMLFILGISSQFGLAEVMITALYDQCPSLRKHKSYIVIGVCLVLFCLGLIMTTRAGIFYFRLFDDYSASFSLMLLIILEIILVIYVYGRGSLINFHSHYLFRHRSVLRRSTFHDGQSDTFVGTDLWTHWKVHQLYLEIRRTN